MNPSISVLHINSCLSTCDENNDANKKCNSSKIGLVNSVLHANIYQSTFLLPIVDVEDHLPSPNTQSKLQTLLLVIKSLLWRNQRINIPPFHCEDNNLWDGSCFDKLFNKYKKFVVRQYNPKQPTIFIIFYINVTHAYPHIHQGIGSCLCSPW